MKVLGVCVSTRSGSGSAEVVKEFLKGAAEAGHETRLVVLTNGNFNGCTGCHACKKPGIETCVQKDAMTEYLQAVPEADAVVFGAGNYMGWPQGQAWDFVHRHFCLSLGIGSTSGTRIPEGKKLYPVFSQGVPVPDMYMERYEQFLAPFKDWGFVTDKITVTCGPLKEKVLQEAYETGKNL